MQDHPSPRASTRPPLWTLNYALTLLGTFTFFGSFFYLLAVLPDYVDAIGGSAWQVGLIVGGFGFVPLFLRPLSGRWSDGGRRLRLMRVALLVFAVSLGLMALSEDIWSLLALRVVQGIGMAMFPTAAGSLVAQSVPPPRRGEGLGFFGMSTSASQMVFPALGFVIADVWGFDAVFLVASVTAAATLLVVALLHEPQPDASGAATPTRTLIPTKALFPMVIFFTVTLAFSATATFLPLLGDERDLGNVGLFFLISGAAALIMRPTAGRMSDRVGRLPVILPGLVFTAVSMWILTEAESFGLMLVAGGFAGAGLGATHTGLFALAIDRVLSTERGSATAVFQMAWDIGGVSGGVLLGFVAQALDLVTVFWVAGALLLVAIALLLPGRMLGWTRPLPGAHVGLEGAAAPAGGAPPAGARRQ